MDYEKMWEKLKQQVSDDVASISTLNTDVYYIDILRMATARIVLQSIVRIEKQSELIPPEK